MRIRTKTAAWTIAVAASILAVPGAAQNGAPESEPKFSVYGTFFDGQPPDALRYSKERVPLVFAVRPATADEKQKLLGSTHLAVTGSGMWPYGYAVFALKVDCNAQQAAAAILNVSGWDGTDVGRPPESQALAGGALELAFPRMNALTAANHNFISKVAPPVCAKAQPQLKDLDDSKVLAHLKSAFAPYGAERWNRHLLRNKKGDAFLAAAFPVAPTAYSAEAYFLQGKETGVTVTDKGTSYFLYTLEKPNKFDAVDAGDWSRKMRDERNAMGFTIEQHWSGESNGFIARLGNDRTEALEIVFACEKEWPSRVFGARVQPKGSFGDAAARRFIYSAERACAVISR